MFAEEPPESPVEALPTVTKPANPTQPVKATRPASAASAGRAATPRPSGDESRGDERFDTAYRSRLARARSVEFAGIASSGVHGTAAGLGAMAGLRFAGPNPLWARLFVAGRSGNIPLAQASTRTAMLGGGLAIAALPRHFRFELGLRFDGFASYFDASHLSEDDDAPALRSRWIPGADAIVEGGVHLAGSTGLFLGGGVEAVFGRTEVYTHGNRVAVVPPWRIVGEFGFRTEF
jgi:hypothetical protein